MIEGYDIEGTYGIKFWMQRVAEEHINLTKKKLDRVNLLAFQSFNFNKMRDEIQEKVIHELFKEIKEVFPNDCERIIAEVKDDN